MSTHSLQKVLERAGYTLLLACHEFDLAAESRMARTFVEKGVDALVLVGTAHHPSTLKLLGCLTVPHVLTWALDRSAAIRASGSTTEPRAGSSPTTCSSSGTGASL